MYKRIINKTSFSAIVMVLCFASLTFSQGDEKSRFTINERAVKNLNAGIKSNNYGLKQDAIKLAGIYIIDDAAATLAEQLKIEEDPTLRICIIKSLYLISNDDYAEIIRITAESDKNNNVRKFAQNLYSIMQLEKSIKIADLNQ